MTAYGKMREDFVMEPVTGKALPVYKGEVLRIVQEEGGQVLDFNCFSLHDYKERMSVGHMRRQGFRLAKGDYVLSAPPRSNLMMFVLEMPETCGSDLLASRCSPDFFEATWGFKQHTNCQDTFAEAIGEYGLTPDDTHDSFNMWTNSGWDDRGRWYFTRNTGQKGDAVDLLSLMDTLPVPIVCGSGDVTGVSNFFLRPLRVQVFESSPETEEIVEKHLHRFGRYSGQRSLDEFRVQEIKTSRELTAEPGYEPQFVNTPLETEDVKVTLTAEDYRQVKLLQEHGLADNDEDAVRSAVFGWHLKNRSEPNPFKIRA